MRSRVFVYYTLTGPDLDSAEITEASGVPSARIWLKGDLVHPKAIITYKQNGWSVASRLPESAPLQEHVSDLLELLQHRWSVFAELGTRYHAELECIVYAYGNERPAIHLEAEMVRQLSELSVAIDVDLYFVSE
jgi:Domain of unknown function (DUF4279)